MDFSQQPGVTITLLNLTETQTTPPGFSSVAGDARDLRQFKDDQFDVVFSNSVIEHVGPYHDQCRMAKEIIRVGKRYFLQTPNRYFPIEPHFLFPFFQFLPQRLQIWLLGHFSLGWYDKIPDKLQAARAVGSVNLLDKSQIKKLFPGATIVEERFLSLAKSFIIYNCWDRQPAARPAGVPFEDL